MTTTPDAVRALQRSKPLEERPRGAALAAARHHREHAPHIDALIKLVSVRIVRLSEMILRIGAIAFSDRFGIKTTELRILVMLGAFQPISVNEVSRRTHIDKAWISRSLRGLLHRKLITKTAHPSDSRAALLTLTKKGEALLREIAPVAQEYQRQLLQGQRPRDVERVLDLLSARAEEMFHAALQQKPSKKRPS